MFATRPQGLAVYDNKGVALMLILLHGRRQATVMGHGWPPAGWAHKGPQSEQTHARNLHTREKPNDNTDNGGHTAPSPLCDRDRGCEKASGAHNCRQPQHALQLARRSLRDASAMVLDLTDTEYLRRWCCLLRHRLSTMSNEDTQEGRGSVQGDCPGAPRCDMRRWLTRRAALQGMPRWQHLRIVRVEGLPQPMPGELPLGPWRNSREGSQP